MKRFFCLIFLIFISSCSGQKNNYCFIERGFDFSINSTDLNKINKKILLDNLINNSNIEYKENSDLKIVLNIQTRRTSSLTSLNNSTLIENINFTTEYKILDKGNLITEGKIIIIDNSDVFDNRFANYAVSNYIMENFSKNLTKRLENKVDMMLKNNYKNCKN